MFTKQDLEWTINKIQDHVVTATMSEIEQEYDRYTSVMGKLSALMADHPEDEEAAKPPDKPAAKPPDKPAAKKAPPKKSAAKK